MANDAIHAFAQGTISGVIEGMTLMYKVLKALPQEFSDCTAISDELSALGTWLAKFLSPTTLIATITKNMVFHSAHVFSDLSAAIDAWNKADFYNTGLKIGDALYVLTE